MQFLLGLFKTLLNFNLEYKKPQDTYSHGVTQDRTNRWFYPCSKQSQIRSGYRRHCPIKHIQKIFILKNNALGPHTPKTHKN